MRVNIIRQAVAQLPAIAANLVLLAPALEMLEPQRIHRVRIPDRLHGLDAHVADHQLAAPIEEARADQSVRVHGITVEDIRTGIGFTDVLLVDAFGDLHTGVLFHIEFRPARRKVLHENAVAVIAEGVEESLTWSSGEERARNLDDDLAITSVGVDPTDVVDELFEVE